MATERTTSLSAYARLRKVARQTVHKWKDRGLVLVDAAGRVRVVASNAMLASRAEVYRGGRIGGTPKGYRAGNGNGHDGEHDMTTAEAVAEKEHWLALMRELDYHEAAGDVVEIEAVEQAVAARYAILRNRMMALGAKIAVQVIEAATPEEKLAIVNAELSRVMECLNPGETFAEIKRACEAEWDAADDEQ